tara:strand:- start:18 stop:239 length:222 start_codon:yes stop_codon:yes gene_type:complete
MGNIIRQTRGTESEHQNYVGEKGVISLVTNEEHEPTGEIRVHDGKTAGGIDPLSELRQMIVDLQNRVDILEGS